MSVALVSRMVCTSFVSHSVLEAMRYSREFNRKDFNRTIIILRNADYTVEDEQNIP